MATDKRDTTLDSNVCTDSSLY